MPEYIPVYIQYGDVPPEDTKELDEYFKLAAKRILQRSHIIYNDMTTRKVTEQSESAPGAIDTTTNYSVVNNDSPSSTGSIVDVVSNGVPVESDSYVSNGSKI
jgi:hypothetical protein